MKNFKITKKMIIIASVIVGILVIAGITLNLTLSSSDTAIFNDIELVDKDLGKITLSNINITNKSGIYNYRATATAKQDVDVKYINIVMKDDKENVVVTMIGYIGSSMKADDTSEIDANTDADLSTVKSISYEIVEGTN